MFFRKSELLKTILNIGAICIMTGAIVYGGVALWPQLAVSGPGFILGKGSPEEPLQYLYSVGGGLTRPNAVAVDDQGRVYVTDAGTKKVHVYAKNGLQLFEFGGTGQTGGEFGFPNGIVITGDGSLMVADSIKNNVQLFSPRGKYLKTILNMGDQGRPGYLFRDRAGLIYVSDLLHNRVLVMQENGKLLYTIASTGNPLSYPQAVARDTLGRIWVADAGSYSLRIFEPGNVTKGKNVPALEVSAVKGGGNPETSFSMVRGIVFDESGRGFAADTLSGKVRIFDVNGQQLGLFPSSPRKEKKLVFPTNLFIDRVEENLYVVDRAANEIKIFAISMDKSGVDEVDEVEEADEL